MKTYSFHLEGWKATAFMLWLGACQGVTIGVFISWLIGVWL